MECSNAEESGTRQCHQINVATNIHNTNSGSLAISTIAANSTDKLHTDTPASANTTHTPSLILNPVPPNAKSKSPAPSLTSSQKEKVVQLETYMSTKQTNLDTDTIQHLLSLPANHFTLQLLSSDKLNDLTDFIKTNKLTKDVYIYHTDKDRYILIYGIYETEHAALAAIKQLPLAARELKPWVRSIASVQEALNPKPKIAIEAN